MSEQIVHEPEQIPKRVRWGMRAAYAALAIIVIAVGVFMYWSFQPDDVLTVKNNPVPVRTINGPATSDGIVILNVDYCKNVEATGRLRYSFVSATREIFLPVAKDDQPASCSVRDIPVLIPHDMPPDTYRIKFRIEYQLNPVKKVIEEFESLEFQVTGEVPKMLQ